MRRLLISKLRWQQNNSCRLIQRTAVYGPVRTVVWEGRSCEAPLSRLYRGILPQVEAHKMVAPPCFYWSHTTKVGLEVRDGRDELPPAIDCACF